MNKLFGSWKFYKKTLLIAIPIMVQNLITNFVALIDNIMVGQVGTEQMSGVAIVNQIFFVFNLALFGAISGASIFCAQFFGKKDYEGVRHTFRFKLITVTLLTILGLLIFTFFGAPLIQLYLHDTNSSISIDATFGYAKRYMAIMLAGLIPFAFEQAYSSTLRESGDAIPPMIAGIVAVIINTVFNYLLIFGIGFFPELGVDGAAIATVFSRFIQVAIVVIWTHANSKKLGFVSGLYRTMHIPCQLVRRICIKGLIPLTANECLWAAGVAALVQCYSLRGIDVVAGLNIGNTVINLFNVLFIAFGSGVSVVLGQLLGSNNLKTARETAPRLIIFSGVMCVFVGAVMAAFAGIFPKAYNTTDEVRALAKGFIIVSSAYMPFHAILHSTYFTIRSGGKTFITFLFDSGFSWLVVVPTAYCLAHFTDINIIVLYSVCQFIEIIKLVIGAIIIKKGVWLSNIVAD